MKTEKPFDYQHVDRPPPGAGRTCSTPAPNTQNPYFYCKSCRTLHPTKRQLAAERGANTTRRNGEYTGNAFPGRSPPLTDPEWFGLTAIIAWPLIIILLATLGDLRCHPGDRNTINGRDLCPTEKAP